MLSSPLFGEETPPLSSGTLSESWQMRTVDGYRSKCRTLQSPTDGISRGIGAVQVLATPGLFDKGQGVASALTAFAAFLLPLSCNMKHFVFWSLSLSPAELVGSLVAGESLGNSHVAVAPYAFIGCCMARGQSLEACRLALGQETCRGLWLSSSSQRLIAVFPASSYLFS